MTGRTSPEAPPRASDSWLRTSAAEFELIRKLVQERFGIHLTEDKRFLLEGRLQGHLRGLGCASFGDYYEHLRSPGKEGALHDLAALISTNHTFFYREQEHFEYFRDTAFPEVVARLKKEGCSDLRIWCAGCSSGEEAYVLLMLMRECLGRDYGNWDAGILATDISGRVLEIARDGIYPAEKVTPLPEALRRRYMRELPDGRLQVRDELRQEATFRRFNLMNPVFPFRHPFQIIFCRNVMIYFDPPTRQGLIERFHRSTGPEGYLFVGHSESLGPRQSLYRYLKPAVYRKSELS